MLIAIPEGFEAGAIAAQAKAMRPDLTVIARAHSDEQVEHLRENGADRVVMGEREIAREMLRLAAADPGSGSSSSKRKESFR